MSAIDTARGDATVLRNAACDRARPYGAAEQAILSRARGLEALAAISAWAGYAPTPVHALSTIAAAYKVKPAAIIEANDLKNPDVLRKGQKLFIPQ